MNTNFLKIVYGFATLSVGAALAVGSAVPITISSGFNADVIADGSGSASLSSINIDAPAGNNVFYDPSYDASHGNHGGSLSSGLLTDGGGDQFSIASASGFNALRLTPAITSGSLSLSTPTAEVGFYILGTATDGGITLNYQLNFVGGFNETGTLGFGDWYAGSGAINGLGRVRLNDTYDALGNNFTIYKSLITVSVPNQSLLLQSIDFNYSSGGNAAIFAASSISVPEPSVMALSALGGIGGLILFRRRK